MAMETIGLVEIILTYVLYINKLDLGGEIVEKKNDGFKST
jgi:hypothetical protein